MDEEEKMEGQKPAVTNNDEGDKPKTTDQIKSADKAAERLERANTKKEELLDREEALIVQSRLSGRSEGGSPMPPEETEDEKWAREAKLRYEGTGLDPTG